jgi:hypothetical protein
MTAAYSPELSDSGHEPRAPFPGSGNSNSTCARPRAAPAGRAGAQFRFIGVRGLYGVSRSQGLIGLTNYRSKALAPPLGTWHQRGVESAG